VRLLDTNVLSELMRPAPAVAVMRWLQVQRHEDLFTSSITVAELRTGVALLPEGARRRDLGQRLNTLLTSGFGARILGFDASAAAVYADLMAIRQRAGRPATGFDLLIAAIAKERGWPVVTRNVADFEGCGLVLINPWESGLQ
jgi:predicted nucleic acid-binding protein